MVSCRELAEFQHARTFVSTFGLQDIDAVRDFIRTHPSSPLLKDAYMEISRFFRLEDEEGRVWLDEFVARFPNDPEVLKAYVAKIEEIRDPAVAERFADRAMTLAERIGEVYPSTSVLEASKSLARLALDKQDPARAEAAYGPDFMRGQSKSWADGLMTYAEFWLGKKRNQPDAGAAIERALSLTPDDPGILRRAASAYHFLLAQPDKAIAVYGPGLLPKIADDPQELYAYFRFWAMAGANVASAEQALDMVLKLRPASTYYRIGAASVYLKPGRLDRPLALFGPAFIATKQDDFAALYDYGMYWAYVGLNLDSAVPALIRALRESPSLWTNHWRAAQLLVKLKRPELALQIFGPEYLPHIAVDASALAMYADFWSDQRTNQDSAREALETASRLKDVASSTLNEIASALVRAGRPDRVDEFYGPDHLARIGDDPLALLFYAGFWRGQGRNLPSALAAIERACVIREGDPLIWEEKAQVLLKLARPADALKTIDQAIALDKYRDHKEHLGALRKSILEELEKLKN